MKATFTLPIYFFALAAIIIQSSCQKNDPCEEANPLSADFIIKEVPTNPAFETEVTYDTDSVSSIEVQFSAKEKNANYQWKIGTDLRTFYGSDVTLKFQGANEQQFDVQLLVHKSGPCLGTDTIKSHTRTFFLRTSQLSGTFEGTYNYSPYKAKLVINTAYRHPLFYTADYPYPAPDFEGILLSDLPVYDSLFISKSGYELLNRQLFVQQSNLDNPIINKTLKYPKGKASLAEDKKTLSLELEVYDKKSNSYKTLKFQGIKIS